MRAFATMLPLSGNSTCSVPLFSQSTSYRGRQHSTTPLKADSTALHIQRPTAQRYAHYRGRQQSATHTAEDGSTALRTLQRRTEQHSATHTRGRQHRATHTAKADSTALRTLQRPTAQRYPHYRGRQHSATHTREANSTALRTLQRPTAQRYAHNRIGATRVRACRAQNRGDTREGAWCTEQGPHACRRVVHRRWATRVGMWCTEREGGSSRKIRDIFRICGPGEQAAGRASVAWTGRETCAGASGMSAWSSNGAQEGRRHV